MSPPHWLAILLGEENSKLKYVCLDMLSPGMQRFLDRWAVEITD